MNREISGRVKELLRRDRRTQRHILEREPFPGLRHGAAPLEELPGRPAAQLDDLVPLEPTDPPRIERHQPHAIPLSLAESLFLPRRILRPAPTRCQGHL